MDTLEFRDYGLTPEDNQAIEETLHYFFNKPDATYDNLIDNIMWYWRGGTNENPKEWLLDWITFLTGEYEYENFSLRRGNGGDRSTVVEHVRESDSWDYEPGCIFDPRDSEDYC